MTLEYYQIARLEALSGLDRLAFLNLEHTNVKDVNAVRPLTALTVLKWRTPK